MGRKPTKEEFQKEWEGFKGIIGKTPSGGFKRMMVVNEEQGFRPNDYYSEGNVFISNTPITPQAKAIDGSYAGFTPKPAVEVVLVAMKPLETKTYVEQALNNGKGITWLDNGRIPYESDEDRESVRFGVQVDITGGNYGATQSLKKPRPIIGRNKLSSEVGRFPGNILVSDNVLNDGKVSKSTGGKSGHTGAYSGGYKEEYYGNMKPGLGDSGSFSRYFNLDAWWNKKLEELPESVKRTFPFLIVPKPSQSEKNRGCEGLKEAEYIGVYADDQWSKEHMGNTPKVNRGNYKNHHPTCKPLKLMSYLITLGSREGDTILDPFMGSGTTCLAAKMLGRKSIGIEIDKSYCEIAIARNNNLNNSLFSI